MSGPNSEYDPVQVTPLDEEHVEAMRVAALEAISGATDLADLSFQNEAQAAVDLVAATFDGWGPTIHKQVRSGSPAQEIVRAAEDLGADLISMAAGSRGLTPTILLGSTASRVQHSAPCPVLICRPTARSERATA